MRTAEELEGFREAILRVLDANRTRFGLPARAVGLMVRQFGFGAEKEELLDELDYLAGKGLVEEAPRPISAENRAWRITEAGIALVDRGL